MMIWNSGVRPRRPRSALTAIERAVAESGEAQAEPAGLIRINTSRIAARLLLEPRLDEFLARHPRVRLELVLDDGLSKCVAPHLANGSLVRVLEPWCRPFPGFFLYVPSRAQMPAKIRALVAFLVEQRKRFEREAKGRTSGA